MAKTFQEKMKERREKLKQNSNINPMDNNIINEILGTDDINKEKIKTSINESRKEIMDIDVNNLIEFNDHNFSLLTGEKKEELKVSIETSGILEPLLVTDIENERIKKMILAGHNRWNIAKELGILKVPCCVLHDLSKAEQKYIVITTNLARRTPEQMTTYEKARNIVDSIELLKEIRKEKGLTEETQGRTNEKVAEAYEISNGYVKYYKKIIESLLKKLFAYIDNKKIPSVAVAYQISFLPNDKQKAILEVLDESDDNFKLDENLMKELHKKYGTDNSVVETIDIDSFKELFNKKIIPKAKKNNFKFRKETYEKFFKNNKDEKSINDIIEKALEMYFKNQNIRSEDNGEAI